MPTTGCFSRCAVETPSLTPPPLVGTRFGIMGRMGAAMAVVVAAAAASAAAAMDIVRTAAALRSVVAGVERHGLVALDRRGAVAAAAGGTRVAAPRPHVRGRRAAAVVWAFLPELSDEWDGSQVDAAKWRNYNPIWYVVHPLGGDGAWAVLSVGNGIVCRHRTRTRAGGTS